MNKNAKQSKAVVNGDDDKDVFTTRPMHPIDDDDDDDDDAYMQLVKGLDLAHQAETPWTEEEHNSFLEGYRKYSHICPKKCWKTISKKYVKTKNHTEVQLHGEIYLYHLKPKPICTPSNSNNHPPIVLPNNQLASLPSPPSSNDDNNMVIMDKKPVVLPKAVKRMRR